MNKPISWQMCVCVVFALLVAGPCAMLLVAASSPMEVWVERCGLAVGCLIIVLFWMWDRRVNHGKDVYPDLLAELSAKDAQWQVGAAQFSLAAVQEGNLLHLTVLIQNIRDRVGRFRLGLAEDRGFPLDRYPPCLREIPLLDCQMPGAGVISAAIKLPLQRIESATSARVKLCASGQAPGRRIRFKNRTAATKGTNPALAIASIAAGHLHYREQTAVKIALDPCEESTGPQGARWDVELLWSPEDAASLKRSSNSNTESKAQPGAVRRAVELTGR